MRSIAGLIAALLITGSTQAQEEVKQERAAIDVVFCIDCSGSMGRIIETAKQKIWMIVNEIATAKPTPRLRIGLIGYGNGKSTHRFFQMTDDLDVVYEKLMTFKDEGWGDEWVGLAIQKATEEMQWSKEKGALKLIFVAGNETAKQGDPDYTVSAPKAIQAGIMINALYCGVPNATEALTWQEVAKLADGSYAAIDQSGGAVTIETPFDKQLGALTASVNKTYIPIGRKGLEAQQRQVEQDNNSKKSGGDSNLADRACAKNWSGYNCASWDLVDACASKKFKWADIKNESLPKEMQKMTLEEKKAFVEKKRLERLRIQKEVAEIGKKRTAYIQAEMKKLGDNKHRAFDENVKKMLRSQAAKKNYRFEKE